MQNKINKLITYSNQKGFLNTRDNDFIYNQLCYLLNVTADDSYTSINYDGHIDDLLDNIANEYKQFETNTERELFKSKVIGIILPRPSEIEKQFYKKSDESMVAATNYFYDLSKSVNYIKEREIAKNIEYKVDSKYGEIDITINLSKPEKTTKEIEALKNATSSNWPKCFLCKEQEGLYGSLKNPDRSNHRVIKMDLNDKDWYFQYSPFSYFNEHSILLSGEHEDMAINRKTFSNLLEFVDKFDHYMIGSNADLPIVGGSMLTHDHYQTGNYEFGLFKTASKFEKEIDGVELHSLNWPLHTVKLIGDNKDDVLNVAELVLNEWQEYEDKENKIIKFTSVRHNTITPIIRKQNGKYEVYLILRNNLTSEDHPTGIYHVDKVRHHIKQENIGLIEAMGLAVLPARLKTELETIASSDSLPEELTLHKPLYDKMVESNCSDRKEFLYNLVGSIFVQCLEDCGVFKYDETKYYEFIRGINE